MQQEVCKGKIGKHLGIWFNAVNIYWALISAVHIQGNTTMNVTRFFPCEAQTIGDFYLLTWGIHWKNKDWEKVHPGSSDVVKSFFFLVQWTRKQSHRKRAKLIYTHLQLFGCIPKGWGRPFQTGLTTTTKKVRLVWSTIKFKLKKWFYSANIYWPPTMWQVLFYVLNQRLQQ